MLSSTLSLALTTTLCFALICKQTFDCAPLFLSVLSSSSCSSMAVSKLEPELRDSIRSQYGDSIQHVYFNKGLWGQEGWLEFSIRRTRLNSCVSISWPKSVIISHNEMLLCSFFFITFSNWCLSLDVCCGTFDQCCHLILTLITTVWIPAEKPNDLLSGTARQNKSVCFFVGVWLSCSCFHCFCLNVGKWGLPNLLTVCAFLQSGRREATLKALMA